MKSENYYYFFPSTTTDISEQIKSSGFRKFCLTNKRQSTILQGAKQVNYNKFSQNHLEKNRKKPLSLSLSQENQCKLVETTHYKQQKKQECPSLSSSFINRSILVTQKFTKHPSSTVSLSKSILPQSLNHSLPNHGLI